MYMSIQQMRVNVLPATILPISDLFFTEWYRGLWYGDDKVYSVVGFGPGFDASYVVPAFQSTTNAILTELNNVRRRRLGAVTFIPPSSGKGKGGKGGSGTSSGKVSSGKGSSGKGSSGKGGKGGSGAGFIRPEYTVAELVASLGSPGNYAVSPEVTETLLYLSNTESADFIAALSGSSDAITSTITNVVDAVKTLVGANPSTAVAGLVECLECLGSLFVNIAKPDPNVTCSTTCQL